MTAAPPSHVLITGASGGLGAALAQHYARPGALLTLLGRDAGRLATVAQSCRARGADVATHILDVLDARALEDVLLTADQTRDIDLLVANAGIGGAGALAPPTGETGPQARQIVEVNTLGVINTLTPLLPAMVARGRGQVVIIGSLAGLEGLAESPAYSASKAAVRAYGHGLRRLLAPKGVRVTVVSAGFIATPMAASLPFAPPFVVSAEAAARRIAHAAARGRREIVFPWQFNLLMTVGRVFPAPVVDLILRQGQRLAR